MELDVMYEDEDVLVVNKPAGLVVHPGNGNYTGTLVHGVAWHLLQQQNHLPPDLSNGRPVDAQFNEVIPRPGLVHRLDKDTTGVMVLGKTEHAMTSLSQQFFERSVDRRYLALVWGDLEEDGTIEGHIGRNRRNRKIQAVFPHGDEGKHATTHYTVLERLGPVTLLECKLETGRTHQIRVHMEHRVILYSATCHMAAIVPSRGSEEANTRRFSIIVSKYCRGSRFMRDHWLSHTPLVTSGWFLKPNCPWICIRSLTDGSPI